MKSTLFLFFALITLTIQGQQSEIFNSRLQDLLKEEELRGASISFLAEDMESGKTLAELNATELMNPASVLKIPTTITGLKLLGGDFQFSTILAYDGKMNSDTLNGNIIVIGGGDPSLGSRFFDDNLKKVLDGIINDLKNAGINHINGDLVINSSHFSGNELPPTRVWEDMGNYYGGGAYGLNISDNTYSVVFKTPDVAGEKAEIVLIDPKVPNLEIRSEVKSANISYDNAYIFGSPLDTKRVVRGELPKGQSSYTIKGAIPNPPEFFGYHLLKALKDSGINISGNYTVDTKPMGDKNLHQIAQYFSESLKTLVLHTNKNSDNLFAESILKEIGAANGDGSDEAGIEAMKKFWKNYFQPGEPFFFYDGSGLSRFNSISAIQVVKMLRVANDDEGIQNSFRNSLPISGLEGSMRNVGKNSGLANNMRAKSGYMQGVRAYAGYLKTASGKEVAFSFIANNYNCTAGEMRRKMERTLIDFYQLH